MYFETNRASHSLLYNVYIRRRWELGASGNLTASFWVVLFTNCTNHLNQCLPKLIVLSRFFFIFPSTVPSSSVSPLLLFSWTCISRCLHSCICLFSASLSGSRPLPFIEHGLFTLPNDRLFTISIAFSIFFFLFPSFVLHLEFIYSLYIGVFRRWNFCWLPFIIFHSSVWKWVTTLHHYCYYYVGRMMSVWDGGGDEMRSEICVQTIGILVAVVSEPAKQKLEKNGSLNGSRIHAS